MKKIFILFIVPLGMLSCEPQFESQEIGCVLPPEFCEMEDDEFKDAFNAMGDEEQIDLIVSQIQPSPSGFVSIAHIATIYDGYKY